MPSNAARPEGERWFEWPLTPTSIGMTAAELICAWKAKDPSQLGPEPAGYVKGA